MNNSERKTNEKREREKKTVKEKEGKNLFLIQRLVRIIPPFHFFVLFHGNNICYVSKLSLIYT